MKRSVDLTEASIRVRVWVCRPVKEVLGPVIGGHSEGLKGLLEGPGGQPEGSKGETEGLKDIH